MSIQGSGCYSDKLPKYGECLRPDLMRIRLCASSDLSSCCVTCVLNAPNPAIDLIVSTCRIISAVASTELVVWMLNCHSLVTMVSTCHTRKSEGSWTTDPELLDLSFL